MNECPFQSPKLELGAVVGPAEVMCPRNVSNFFEQYIIMRQLQLILTVMQVALLVPEDPAVPQAARHF